MAASSHAVLCGAPLAVLALLLHGCGDKGNGSSKPQRTTVIVMRHCARSTPLDGIRANASYEYMNNYSGQSWPVFPVPPMFCLQQGTEIIEGQGRWWKAHGGLDTPVRAIADLITNDAGQRDNVTMHSFLKGLDLSGDSVSASLDHGPFAPSSSSACESVRPNTSVLTQSAKSHLEANPPPKEYPQYLQTLFRIMGEGVAGNWTIIPCSIGWLYNLPGPVGACQAAAEFTERLLMEWGGNMTVGWSSLSAEQIPQIMLLHAWHFYNWFAPPEVYRYLGASLARAILRDVSAAEGGTTLYVGHDTDLMVLKGMLGLLWTPAPFPSNATIPGSMLRFVREGDRVRATLFYVKTFSDTSGEMLSVDAAFSTTSSAEISLNSFQGLLESGSLAACASGSSRSADNLAYV
jgi:hypothetical protein